MPIIQTTIFDTAIEAAEHGIAKAEENANKKWLFFARISLHSVCQLQGHFSSDDVLTYLTEHFVSYTHELRALAGVLRYGAKKGWCKPSGLFLKTNHIQSHGRPKQQWDSLITRL